MSSVGSEAVRSYSHHVYIYNLPQDAKRCQKQGCIHPRHRAEEPTATPSTPGVSPHMVYEERHIRTIRSSSILDAAPKSSSRAARQRPVVAARLQDLDPTAAAAAREIVSILRTDDPGWRFIDSSSEPRTHMEAGAGVRCSLILSRRRTRVHYSPTVASRTHSRVY